MTWADLLPGDVLMHDSGYPVVLVLRCDVANNTFAWMRFRGECAGEPTEVDFVMAHMWAEPLGKSYKLVLRGSEELVA